eukprot:TRINITY_DN318_c0_g2_i1.p1 TRINITY_DN318_c0_g2~~TRINITY_DN318_c0_g2_i1.p1  ORF type:complete len:918 (+),score=220.49 TRINITY_DN318_c0_g2_i1:14-2767(+)
MLAAGLLFASLAAAVGHYRQVGNLAAEPYGLSATIEWTGEPLPYGTPISPARLEILFYDAATVRVKVVDPANVRWEVPGIVQVEEPVYNEDLGYLYDVQVVAEPLNVLVFNKQTLEPLWSTTSLYFADQYVEFGSQLPENPYVYGIGERIAPFRLPVERNYTIFATDNTTPEWAPLYGSHAMFMEMRPSGAHGVWFLNSNAMDVALGLKDVTFKSVGGVVDLWVFAGPDPEEVTKQYHRIIGTPFMIPYWPLGFHQCRWGYKSLDEVRAVVAGYRDNNIPLEAMWIDIDHMERYKDFTFDPVQFPAAQVSAFADELHNNEQSFVLIVDPGVKVEAGYSTYESLLDSGLFLRNQTNDGPLVGKVWPELVVFPDFTNPNTETWWSEEIAAFYQQAKFDGLWIDMNELANFCDGRCILNAEEENGTDLFRCVCSQTTQLGLSLNEPLFYPGTNTSRPCRTNNFVGLDCASVDMISHAALGLEYNVHNLHGHLESVATANALQTLRNKRPFVLSRSTTTGTGHYAGHWLGDNHSRWSDLAYSIAGMLNMQIFGIPFTGADICGFVEDTTEELCIRWMQLGSLYPFARNHNANGQMSQEPYVFGEPLITISRNAILTRYSLNAYYYTLFYLAHANGGTVMRPLFFLDPQDSSLWTNDRQFTIGDAVMVCPVVTEGAASVSCQFPRNTKWYSFASGEVFVEAGSSSTTKTVNVALTDMPMFIRAGSVLPLQRPGMTTSATRRNDFDVVVALGSEDSEASGVLYLDDGDSIDPVSTGAYSMVEMRAHWTNEAAEGKKAKNVVVVESSAIKTGYAVPAGTARIASLKILGAPCNAREVGQVEVNEEKVKLVNPKEQPDGQIEVVLEAPVGVLESVSVRVECWKSGGDSGVAVWVIVLIVGLVVAVPAVLYFFWVRSARQTYRAIN